jgi:hypothetical protein
MTPKSAVSEIADKAGFSSPEVRLVVLCARPELDEPSRTEVDRILSGRPDWSEIARWASWHQVVPVVWKRLENDFPGNLPDFLAEEWGTNCEVASCVARRQLDELVELIDLFAVHGVPMIPYKGPALALQLYEDITLRPCRDLDFIVRRNDADQAMEILYARGYVRLEPGMFSPRQTRYLLELYGQSMLRHPELEIDVEPHWRLTPWVLAADLDEEGLWTRSTESTLAGRPCLSLSSEDKLIVLGTHGSKELWNRLKSLSDIARLLTRESDLDWEVAFDRARRLGVLRMVLVGLSGASRILGAPIPSKVEEFVAADRGLTRLVEEVEQGTFVEPRILPTLTKPCSFRIYMRERFRDRARYVVRTLVAPTTGDLRSLSLPDRLFFVYYLLRLLDLLAVGPTRRIVRQLVSTK